ncbi:MAG: hypothetical protein H5T63_10865 [Chloroflexi bacterium]|nr:hypothetical protein [Chloroflexota bacterium]
MGAQAADVVAGGGGSHAAAWLGMGAQAAGVGGLAWAWEPRLLGQAQSVSGIR